MELAQLKEAASGAVGGAGDEDGDVKEGTVAAGGASSNLTKVSKNKVRCRREGRREGGRDGRTDG